MLYKTLLTILFIWICSNQFVNAEIDPNGKNVCFKSQYKNQTIQVKYTYQLEVYTYKVCLKFPFRCKFKKTEYRVGIRPENKTIQYKVAHCCDGYVEEGEKCVSHCSSPCEHGGECIRPNVCDCQLGTGGLNCNATCPSTKFGLNCEYDCKCLTNPHCNKNYFDCSCKPGDIPNECRNICKCKSSICNPGFIGKSCEKPCPSNTFGSMCIGKCLCVEQNTLECKRDNGDCRCRPSYYGVYCEHECTGKLICDSPNNCKCVIESNQNISEISLKRENTGEDLKQNNHGLIFSLIGLLVVTISLTMLLFYKYKVKTNKLKRDLQNVYVRYSTGGSNDQFDNPVYSYATMKISNIQQPNYPNSIYSTPSTIQTTTLPHPPKSKNQFNYQLSSLTTPRKPKQNGYLNELSLVPNDLFLKKNQLADEANPNLMMKRDATLNSNIYATVDEAKTIKDSYKNEFENDIKHEFDLEFSTNLSDDLKASKNTFKIPEDNDSVDLAFMQITKKNESLEFNDYKDDGFSMHYDKPNPKSPAIRSITNNLAAKNSSTYEIPKKISNEDLKESEQTNNEAKRINNSDTSHYDTLDSSSSNTSYYENLKK